MGVLIKIAGATFKKENIIGKVEIPEVECDHVYDHECDTTCNLCGAVRDVPHNLVHVEAVEATDTENGNVEYWHCTLCGGYWLDEACTQPTTAEDVVVLSIGSYPVKATLMGLYDLGGTLDDSLVNRAPADNVTAETEVAALPSPTTLTDDSVTANYVHFSGTLKEARMLTKINALPENTITAVALFRVPAPATPTADNIHRVIIGNRGSNYIGVNMMNDYVFYGLNEENTVVTSPYDGGAINSDNFVILAMRVDTDGVKVFRYTNDALTELVGYGGSINAWSTSATTYAFQIGGNGTSSTYGDADISLAAIHKGDMTEEQLTEICEFVRKYGKNTKGLTIE